MTTTLSDRLAAATREIAAIAALVDLAVASGDGSRVTIISAKVQPPISDLTRARAMAARARVWPVLRRARGL